MSGFCHYSVTVVAQYSTFWVKLPGPIINLPNATPLPTQSGTAPPLSPPTTPSILPGPVSTKLPLGLGHIYSPLRITTGIYRRLVDFQFQFLPPDSSQTPECCDILLQI